MNAQQLLEGMVARGFAVSLNGEHLAVSPKSSLTPEMRDALKAHKSEIVSLLSHGNAFAPSVADAPQDAPDFGASREAARLELAHAILESRRPSGGFDFGKVRPYWHAANELTGTVMDSPTLAAWAKDVLEQPL